MDSARSGLLITYLWEYKSIESEKGSWYESLKSRRYYIYFVLETAYDIEARGFLRTFEQISLLFRKPPIEVFDYAIESHNALQFSYVLCFFKSFT